MGYFLLFFGQRIEGIKEVSRLIREKIIKEVDFKEFSRKFTNKENQIEKGIKKIEKRNNQKLAILKEIKIIGFIGSNEAIYLLLYMIFYSYFPKSFIDLFIYSIKLLFPLKITIIVY